MNEVDLDTATPGQTSEQERDYSGGDAVGGADAMSDSGDAAGGYDSDMGRSPQAGAGPVRFGLGEAGSGNVDPIEQTSGSPGGSATARGTAPRPKNALGAARRDQIVLKTAEARSKKDAATQQRGKNLRYAVADATTELETMQREVDAAQRVANAQELVVAGLKEKLEDASNTVPDSTPGSGMAVVPRPLINKAKADLQKENTVLERYTTKVSSLRAKLNKGAGKVGKAQRLVDDFIAANSTGGRTKRLDPVLFGAHSPTEHATGGPAPIEGNLLPEHNARELGAIQQELFENRLAIHDLQTTLAEEKDEQRSWDIKARLTWAAKEAELLKQSIEVLQMQIDGTDDNVERIALSTDLVAAQHKYIKAMKTVAELMRKVEHHQPIPDDDAGSGGRAFPRPDTASGSAEEKDSHEDIATRERFLRRGRDAAGEKGEKRLQERAPGSSPHANKASRVEVNPPPNRSAVNFGLQ
jgi:hypothetical protein